MKKIILLFLLFSQIAEAQKLNLEWAGNLGTSTREDALGQVCDDSGNVYTIGYFQGVVDFDPGPLSHTLSSKGDFDIFIQKLDAFGSLKWVKSFGSSDQDWGNSIAIDTVGDLYATGSFSDTMFVNYANGSSDTLISRGWGDIYLIKLDGNGNVKWSRSVGSGQTDAGTSIITKGSDKIYVVGIHGATLYPSSGSGNTSIPGSAGGGSFALKYDGGGNLVWAKAWGSNQSIYLYGVTDDYKGDIYLSGYFGGSVDFDPSAATYSLLSSGSGDSFTMKLDAGGSFVWAKAWGGPSNDQAQAVVAGHSGVYTGGYFKDSVDFDPSSSSFVLTSTGLNDAYIQKMDFNGNFLWARKIGGLYDDVVDGLTVDTGDNVYLAGFYNFKVDFDPDTSTAMSKAKGANDAYVLKLDSSGNYKWHRSFGGQGTDWSRSVGWSKNGGVYACGGFAGTADFDPNKSVYNLTSNGNIDAYVLKLGICGLISSNDKVTACIQYTWIDGITYFESNTTATDTLINSNGCDSVIYLKLTLNTVDTGVTLNDPSIQSNAVNAKYQWLDCDNNYAILNGDTNRSFTATSNGNYAVEVRENDCVDTSGCQFISSLLLSEFIKNKISIYPNPSNGILYFDFGTTYANADIIIRNEFGQLVLKKTIKNASNYKLNASIPNGLYFLSIESEDLNYSQSIIISK